MPASESEFNFEQFFQEHYGRVARVVARIVGGPARAEDLAVEAFWKLWKNPQAHGEAASGWVYRTAMRLALNDLRSHKRRNHYEAQAPVTEGFATPEEAHLANEEREQVRRVLASLEERQAELLVLRASGLRYDEVAAALDLNPASVGTLISRAQQAFRKEYVRQYGEPGNQR